MSKSPFVNVRPVIQICWIVDDIETTVNHLAETMGAGPFYILEHIAFRNFRFKGQPATLDQSSAVGQWGAMQIELFQQHGDGLPELKEMIGPGHVQHLTWQVTDFDAEIDRMKALGYSPVCESTVDIPGGEFRGAFLDARDKFGCFFEIYEEKPVLKKLYAAVEIASRSWDGSRPLRPISELLAALEA